MRQPVNLVALAIGLVTATGLSVGLAAFRQAPAEVTVHEWGTFTAVAGPDGQATRWLPLSGPTDLPCFVDHYQNRLFKIDLGLTVDGGAVVPLDYADARTRVTGRVRMETPVIYFYATRPSTVQVDVRFTQGVMTEWYPSAVVTQPPVTAALLDNQNVGSRIVWPSVEIRPGRQPEFPRGTAESHYYAARDTDAAPIRVGGEDEKFLFYRGVAGFTVPVTAVALDDGTIGVRNLAPTPIPGLILFQNTAGRIAVQTVDKPMKSSVTFALPAPVGSVDAVRGQLERLLVKAGLYPREAHAMVTTWGDSWFEEGTRLFYIVPASTTNAMLPLAITPEPVQTTRVFVGRLEILTPAIQETVRAAILARDRATVAKFGRFLAPISVLVRPSLSAGDQVWLDSAATQLFAAYQTQSASCH